MQAPREREDLLDDEPGDQDRQTGALDTRFDATRSVGPARGEGGAEDRDPTGEREHVAPEPELAAEPVRVSEHRDDRRRGDETDEDGARPVGAAGESRHDDREDDEAPRGV